ncbi:glucan biosynthesis protein G [Fodinicurvata sp. EGI_FJ10296]|uniref:glucan biosynthesis protein n=1 Tax=Fodinicurvata sp. EGI_FJ10296 TaxID=3231908 RepID=UPI003452060B
MIDRRVFLKGASACAAWPAAPFRAARAATAPEDGLASVFDPADVLAEARRRAAGRYSPRPRLEAAAELGYDIHRNIRFRSEEALWHGTQSRFEVQMFHPGRFFPEPVDIAAVNGGHVETVPFSQDQYAFEGPASDARARLADAEPIGHAGIRYHYPLNDPDRLAELVSFLGASYFRGLGQGSRYGLSARGLALGTGSPDGEEFPSFVQFWLERPEDGASTCRLHALLDGPSVTGAFSFTMTPGDNTHMDIEATLIPRRDISAIGIAPLTSMYLFGPLDPPRFHDFRPRVHDSQGLCLHLSTGERLWRPLANPDEISTSAFRASSLRGFGLSQRMRDFAAYQDLGADYHLRTGAWIAPDGDWGAGSLQLVELPAADETVDNIVAYWRPDTPLAAGEEHSWRYRLSWGLDPEPTAASAITIESRSSIGGIPGTDDHGTGTKFVVDFGAAPNDDGIDSDQVSANVTASSGDVLNPVAHRNPETGGWRLFFDIVPDGRDPVEIRCFLEHAGGALSETWSYRWTPTA